MSRWDIDWHIKVCMMRLSKLIGNRMNTRCMIKEKER